MSILKKIIIFYIFVTFTLGSALVYFFHQYTQLSEKQVLLQIQTELKVLVKERIESKKQFGITNATTLADNILLQQALKTNNRSLAIKVLSHLVEQYSSYEISNGTNIHIHTKNNFSFVREWKLDKYGDDLNAFRKTVVYVNKNHKNINAFEVGRIGLVLRSIVSIDARLSHEHLGSLELIHNIDSVVHQFASHKDGFLLLMEEKFVVKAFNKSKKLFHYNISQDFIQKDFLLDAKTIDLDFLAKNGYYRGAKYYFIFENVKDFQGRKVGMYLVGRDLSLIQNLTNQKQIFMKIALIIGIIVLVVLMLISYVGLNHIILNPLKKINKGLLSFFNFLQDKSRNIEKIELHTSDEFTVMADSINENIEVSRKLHKEIYELNETLEQKIEERTKDLEKEKESFAAIYNGSKDAIAILDMSSNFLQVNHAYLEMTGLSEEELLKTSCFALSHEGDFERSKVAMQEVLRVGFIQNFEKRCKVKDDQLITINMSMSLLKNPQRVLISVRDVTQLKEIEKAKSEFLSNMSHEIRTPLNAILGFVDILEKRIKDEKSIKYLKIIDTSGKSLLNIINDILDFSKIQSGNFSIEKYDCKIQEDFRNVCNLFFGKIQEKHINLTISIDENVPEILFVDGMRVKQIVTNLLSNALKFTPEDGKIIALLQYKTPNILISITDNGIGISQEHQSKIFSAFKQADSSTTRHYGGTGLGLSISSSLTKLMDGEITLTSELGKGSSFTLKIPVKIATTKKETLVCSEVQERITTFHGHILVAEDNKTNQMLITILLKDYGLTYKLANDGLEAVALFQEEKFDLILMDENMPNLNGIGAMKQIKDYEKKHKLTQTPIIALTANALDVDRKIFLEAGMDSFIAKPIDTKLLEKELTCYLT